jgi:AmmeMemoRadiSam system protein B
LDRRLKEKLGFGLSRVRRDPEHALEIELPFLQRALSGPFRLLPLMVRALEPDTLQALGAALAETILAGPGVERTVLMASSDLSHFYPQRIAAELDAAMLARVAAFDPDGVLQVEEQGQGFACGRGAIAATLWAARALGAERVQMLHYATSGEVSGDFSRVVGYSAAAILRVRE